MQFSLRVIRSGEPPTQIKIDAASATDARMQAEQLGFKVLQVKTSAKSLLIGRGRFPLLLFIEEFRVLLQAGLSLNDVLETLIEKEQNTVNKAVYQQLSTAVREGQPLSRAMSLNSAAFPSLFIATVAAAETTGNLPEALGRYSQYLSSIDVLKKRIVSASVYPMIVLAFGFLVLVFLLVYVIPKFTGIYESQVNKVSSSTQFLLELGRFSQQYGVYIALASTIALVLAVVALTRESSRQKLYDLLWRLPYIGEKVRVYHLSRFYRTFSMLIKSGIPVVNGLTMVSHLLGNSLNANLTRARHMISEGKSFSESLAICGLTTPVALRLFRVGERTGSLEKMMEQAASFHEEEMGRWVERFSKVFEPALMAGIGILIGGIVLLMYMPIFELASGLG